MTRIAWCSGLACVLIAGAFAHGQVVPFFNPGATAFTPQISVVESGVLNDVQATVTPDQKYVTLTMRPQQSSLIALRPFTFQQGAGLGFVGIPAATGAANNAAAATVSHSTTVAANGSSSPVLTSPSAVRAATSQPVVPLLQRPGMTRVSPLRS